MNDDLPILTVEDDDSEVWNTCSIGEDAFCAQSELCQEAVSTVDDKGLDDLDHAADTFHHDISMGAADLLHVGGIEQTLHDDSDAGVNSLSDTEDEACGTDPAERSVVDVEE